MKKSFALLNAFSTIIFIWANYMVLQDQIGSGNLRAIGEAGNVENLIVPENYAFGIWSLIYILLIAYSIFQIQRVFFNKSLKPNEFVAQSGLWLFCANIFSSIWLYAFLNGHLGWSVVCMAIALISLLAIVVNTHMEVIPQSKEVMLWAWLPIGIYSGWLTVAIGPNISTYLLSKNWDQWGLTIDTWAIILVLVLAAIYIYMVLTRKMRDYGLVGIWAISAIYVKNAGTDHTSLANTALVASILIAVAVLYSLSKNWKSSLLYKIFNGAKN